MRCRLCSADAQPAGQSKGLRTGREFSLAHCPACGFAWVVDPITDVASLYDDAYYAGRGSDPLVDFAFEYEHPENTVRQSEWRGVLRIVRRLAPQAHTWLDLGCGTGGLVRYEPLSEVGQGKMQLQFDPPFGYQHGLECDVGA